MSREPRGCLAAILKLFGISPRADAKPALPYRRKDYLLTKAELAFFRVLQPAAGTSYLIFAMVRLADLVYIPKGTESRQSHFNRIQSKHIDFVLCDPDSVRPLLAIELDDSSHSRPERQDRDSFIDAALHDAGLPLLRIPARASYNRAELTASIRESLRA